jgi:hypothetical protein
MLIMLIMLSGCGRASRAADSCPCAVEAANCVTSNCWPGGEGYNVKRVWSSFPGCGQLSVRSRGCELGYQ